MIDANCRPDQRYDAMLELGAWMTFSETAIRDLL